MEFPHQTPGQWNNFEDAFLGFGGSLGKIGLANVDMLGRAKRLIMIGHSMAWALQSLYCTERCCSALCRALFSQALHFSQGCRTPLLKMGGVAGFSRDREGRKRSCLSFSCALRTCCSYPATFGRFPKLRRKPVRQNVSNLWSTHAIDCPSISQHGVC